MATFEERIKDFLSNAYDIERELGGGGMSRVFVARDRLLGRRVVIKLLSPELTAEVNRGRFRREIQVAAQLQHPHIVTLLSAGEDGELVYYTMPYIDGESLKSDPGAEAFVGSSRRRSAEAFSDHHVVPFENARWTTAFGRSIARRARYDCDGFGRDKNQRASRPFEPVAIKRKIIAAELKLNRADFAGQEYILPCRTNEAELL